MQASAAGAGAVIGCDTIVTLHGGIYGKPADLKQARATLRALSGARHEVLSGLAVLVADEPAVGTSGAEEPSARVEDQPAQDAGTRSAPGRRGRSPRRARERVAVARTAVSFRVLDNELLEWYLATGEWRGRAGGYAIQGAGAALVREVAGDYENVVGLPVATLLDIYPELLG